MEFGSSEQPDGGRDLVIESSAPIRICDLGGWTDTWFARHGRVVNIGVAPRVHVRLRSRFVDSEAQSVVVDLENFGVRLTPRSTPGEWGSHALVEATIHQALGAVPGRAVEIAVRSDAPPGAATGTSASVCVALLGALNALPDREHRYLIDELPMVAHRIETDLLHQQSGIQDQICAVHGGVNDIAIHEYPAAILTPLDVAPSLAESIEDRVSLIYLGRPHRSSAIHEMVIRGLERAGPEAPALGALRASAGEGADAIRAGDLAGFGQAMIRNTEAQRALHPGLVGSVAETVIEMAKEHAALGWKVNGAGGDGGSLTVLGADADAKDRLESAIGAAGLPCRVVAVELSGGLAVTSATG